MRNQLDAMEKALYIGAQPSDEAPIVLAALRDKMLGLAATQATPAHTPTSSRPNTRPAPAR